MTRIRTAALASFRVSVVSGFLAVVVGLVGPGRLSGAAKSPPGPAVLAEVDPFIGDYEGTFTPPGGKAVKAVVKFTLFKSGAYQGLAYAPPPTGEKGQDGQDGKKVLEVALAGKRAGGAVILSGKSKGAQWTGRIAGGTLRLSASGAGKFDVKHLVRKSPTEGAKPPTGAVVLLPYQPGRKTTLAAWQHQKWKLLPDGSVQVGGGTNNTKRKFDDFRLHLEFLIPCLIGRKGQGRGNSGVYILGRYELQILDSFGLPPVYNGCGSMYRTKPPKVNMSFPPLSWQTYDVTFRAARYDKNDSGKIVRYPRITVVHNGVKVHDDYELREATGAARKRGHTPSGPIQLQDHGNPVRFRNIWLVELKD